MPQTATTKVLRPAWENAWAALKGWRQWSEPIQTFADTDEDVRRFINEAATLSRVPMIFASWDSSEPRWWVYSEQEWKVPLRINVYVHRDRHGLSMDLIEDAIDAVFRFEAPNSLPAAPVPLIRSQTCRDPEILQFQTGLSLDAGEGGKHKLLQSWVVVRLTLRKDPKLRGT